MGRYYLLTLAANERKDDKLVKERIQHRRPGHPFADRPRQFSVSEWLSCSIPTLGMVSIQQNDIIKDRIRRRGRAHSSNGDRLGFRHEL